MGTSSIVLEAENLTKKFKEGSENEICILQDSSFYINKGEIVSFVGQSGCGKTTLLQMCGLVDLPTNGHIKINGINTTILTDKKRTIIRRNNIGFVYQSHNIFPEFSALENVIMPLLINNISKKNATKKAEEILDFLGLKERINHMPAELSGGEKQRVAIARAIIHKPQLILADEPTGNLDETNSNNVMDLFINVVKQYNLSLLMVTHNINLTKHSDKVITIKDHKIVEF
ncbi:MAG: ABC transporter ATP-binding protein [Rickettsiales bacterium]|nr:ABC transporter ATP-binding protein [Rickettsiales bacterium]